MSYNIACPFCGWESYDCLDAYKLEGTRVYRCLCDGCDNEFELRERGKRYQLWDPYYHELLEEGVYGE